MFRRFLTAATACLFLSGVAYAAPKPPKGDPKLAPVVLKCSVSAAGGDFSKITATNIGSGTMKAGQNLDWRLASSSSKCKAKPLTGQQATTADVGSGQSFSFTIPGQQDCRQRCSAKLSK